MEYIDVARAEAVRPGQAQVVQVGQCSILIVNDDGIFYTFQGLCGHQNLSLAEDSVWQGVLDCPWHHSQYDIRTGENLYPRSVYPLNFPPTSANKLPP